MQREHGTDSEGVRRSMNKKYLLPLLALFLFGCIGNKQIVDTTYTYKKAIVKMPDGESKEIFSCEK